MPSNRRLDQLKSARVAAVQAKKRRRYEVDIVTDPAPLEIDDDKLSTTDTSNMEGESGILFWNESLNEDDSDTEEEGEEVDKFDEGESDLDIDEVKTKINGIKRGKINFVEYTEMVQSQH